jgi:hypothetical protein
MTMGTISEEMKKVMEKWNTSATPTPANQTQPKGNTVQPTQPTNYPSFRAQIYDFINKNPKVTSAGVLDYMKSHHPSMGHSSISSQLTVMFQDCLLTRAHVFDKKTQRNVYGYTAVDPKEAEKMRKERDRKLQQAQERMERARLAKAEKARQRELATANQMSLPLEAPTNTITVSAESNTVTVTPQPVDLHGMTAIQILQAINFTQAKELYKELKEAFGG